MKNNLYELGAKLRQLRLAQRLTQKKFAILFNVQQAAISSWEAGRVYPSLKHLDKILFLAKKQNFELTPDELLSYKMPQRKHSNKK